MLNRKLEILIISLLLAYGMGESFFDLNYPGLLSNTTANICNSIAMFWVLTIILYNGTLYYSKIIFWIIVVCLVIYIVSMGFKIMHWPVSNPLFIVSSGAIIFAYAVHYVQKKPRVLLDHLKMAWVVTAFNLPLFSLMHWPVSPVMKSLPFILFIALFIVFAIQYRKPTQETTNQ